MDEPRRTPGQAEGTEEDIENTLDQNKRRRQSRPGGAQQRAALDGEPGRTPEQAEGTEEQAEGSLRNKK